MLSLVPVSLREANEFVCQHHRHHKPTVGHKFSIGVREDGRLAGVAICGRPVSRFLDDGYTLEVSRLCTDGARNACSMLYGAAVRRKPRDSGRYPHQMKTRWVKILRQGD